MPIGPSVQKNDRLFPVELTNFEKDLTGVIGGNFGAYLFMAAYLFPKYLSIFLDVLSTERI